MENIIKNTYLDPLVGSYSATKFYLNLKDKGVTLKMIKDFLKKQETQQIYLKPTAIKNSFPIYSNGNAFTTVKSVCQILLQNIALRSVFENAL